MDRQKLYGLLGCIVLLSLALSISATADEIAIPDRSFKGDIVQGFPETLSVETETYTANVKREYILNVNLEKPLRVQTTTGHKFEGDLTTSLSEIISMKTSTGKVDVPLEKIISISFPREQVDVPQFCHQVFLGPDLSFNGVVQKGLPDPIQIEDQSDVIAEPRLDSIREIQYGAGEESPDIVRPVEGQQYTGQIVSRIPNTLVLQTIYGSVEISQDAISTIRFLDSEQCRTEIPNNGPSNGIIDNPIIVIAVGGFLLAAAMFIIR